MNAITYGGLGDRIEKDEAGDLAEFSVVKLNTNRPVLLEGGVMRSRWSPRHLVEGVLYEVVTCRKVTTSYSGSVVSIIHTAEIKDSDHNTYMVDVADLEVVGHGC